MQTNFEKLIDQKKHQVFVMYSPPNIFLHFAAHPWFICNEKGKISRWEVLAQPNKDKEWGHLHLNRFPAFSGLRLFPFSSKFHWEGKLIEKIEGNLAKEMIEIIKKSKENYPHKKYSLIGKNSNTYAQWILNHFAECNVKLPWNCFGKHLAK